MTLHDRLTAIVAALPDDAAVTFSRRDLAALLGGSPDTENPPATRDLTVEDVATECGRKPSTVRGWLIAGELRGYKFNRRDWRVTRAALRDYIEGQALGKAAPAQSAADVDITAWRQIQPPRR